MFKWALGIAVLTAGGLFAYRSFSSAGPVHAFEQFAEAWTHGEREEAMRYAEGEAVKSALEGKQLRGTPPGIVMEAFRGEKFEVESSTKTADGDVALVVKETIAFDPAGITSGIGGAMFAVFRHTATVRKTSAGWKVVAFEPTFVEMGDMRRRPR
jgi:hypothetical protein